jgi:hypothetical protein
VGEREGELGADILVLLLPSFWLAGLELKRLLRLGAMDVNDS